MGADPGRVIDASSLSELPRRRRELELRSTVLELGSTDEKLQTRARQVLTEQLDAALWSLNRERASADLRRQVEVAKLLRVYWEKEACKEYEVAFGLAADSDRAQAEIPLSPLGNALQSLVSHEAGCGWLRLVERAGTEGLDDSEKERLGQVRKHLAALEEKPTASLVTPILLSFRACTVLEELLTPAHSVLFDLDGDGVEEGWPWVSPEAGILVWDPEGDGRVRSGRDLFGSASGWLFFGDGYRVLDAFDDDRDGRVAGDELAGLGVWFDLDSDGLSDPGEVRVIESLGVRALATGATERVGLSLGNPCGMELVDGRVRATFDWVTGPVATGP